VSANLGKIKPARIWVNPETSKRQDAAHVLLYPLRKKGVGNLRVLTEHSVTRVELDTSGRARGVVIKSSTGHDAKETKVTARRMVILCAGPFVSPQILERSGVGDPAVLGRAAIPVAVSLPGVGRTYLDHQTIGWNYHSNLDGEHCLDDLWAGRVTESDLASKGDGFLGWTGVGAFGKLSIQDHELKGFDDAFQQRHRLEYPPDKPSLLLVAIAVSLGDHSANGPAATGRYFSISTALAYGYSKGQIHIRSSDPDDPPDFDAGFLTDNDDLQTMVWAYKRSREIGRRMKSYWGLVRDSHPRFNSSSPASADVDDVLVLACDDRSKLDDILYSAADDEAIKECIRENVRSMRHSSGTCPMKAQTEGGVVDERLNVYGTRGLKVAGKW
jgi:alcohol oxidase